MFKKRKNKFMDLCLRGEVLSEEIDNWVDEWHDNPQKQELHEYLGMNWAEYSSWVKTPEILPSIINAHKFSRNLKELSWKPGRTSAIAAGVA
jgi:hypothetical protein